LSEPTTSGEYSFRESPRARKLNRIPNPENIIHAFTRCTRRDDGGLGREKEMKPRDERKDEGEEERGADPDPVTEAGDGTTKSNPPSKIESRRGSVYLMREKTRGGCPPSLAEDQEDRPRRKTKGSGQRYAKAGRK